MDPGDLTIACDLGGSSERKREEGRGSDQRKGLVIQIDDKEWKVVELGGKKKKFG
jgi:hypothetical protein